MNDDQTPSQNKKSYGKDPFEGAGREETPSFNNNCKKPSLASKTHINTIQNSTKTYAKSCVFSNTNVVHLFI